MLPSIFDCLILFFFLKWTILAFMLIYNEQGLTFLEGISECSLVHDNEEMVVIFLEKVVNIVSGGISACTRSLLYLFSRVSACISF
mgnify:CR=1 FL=1